jgi:hypothetical protein
MTTITTAHTLLTAATVVSRAMAKIHNLDEASTEARNMISRTKRAVADALDGDGDFDAASRTFKAANNKLDKLLEQRESLATNLAADLDAASAALAAVTADIRQMDAA